MNLTNPLPRSSLSSQQKSQNLNLNILNLLTQPKQIIQAKNQPKLIPNLSLNDLSQILKQKNHKLQEYRHQRQQVRNWLKDKGVSFNKIQQQVKNNAQIAEQVQAVVLPRNPIKELTIEEVNLLSERQKRSYLEALQTEKQLTKVKWSFKPQTQEQFIIEKQKQNTINLAILRSSKIKGKNKTQQVLLSKMRRIRPNSNFNFNNINDINALNSNPKNQKANQLKKYSYKQNTTKRSKYFQFVSQLCVSGFDQSILNKLKPINTFWQIILHHIHTIQQTLSTHRAHRTHYSHKQSNLSSQQQQKQKSKLYLQISTHLSIQSLHLLQSKYSQSLPDFFHPNSNLKYQFKHLQQKHKNLSMYRNQQGEPIWAMVYYLLRANKIIDVRRVLKNVDNVYVQEIVKYQESIGKGQPRASARGFDLNRYRDKFYKQIIFILKGISMLQAEVNDIDSLNKIWIILRTLAIYRYIPQKNQQYNEILDGFFEKQIYTCKSISKSSIQQYLYLTAYKQTLRFCQININKRKIEFSQDFNNDDYFHFVMIVNYYPQLCGYMTSGQIKQMKQKFVQFLFKYLEILYKQQHYKIIPAYLLLSPPQQFQQISFKFINTRTKYLNFPWSTLKQLLLQRDQQNGLSTFEQFSFSILNNIKLSTFYDYKFISQQFRSRFYKQKQSKFKEQEYSVMILLKKLYFIEKKKFYLKLSLTDGSNKEIQKWTQELMGFFEIQNQNKLQEKEIELVREVRRCEELLQYKRSTQKNDNDIHHAILILSLIYIIKFINIIKQHPLTKKFTPTWFINSQLADILRTKPNPTPILLLQLLKCPSTQPLISLYIYYLISLIKRQQLLCAQQCDYYSLANFKQKVIQQLSNLQNYHQSTINQSSPLFSCIGWLHVMKNKYPQLFLYQLKIQKQNLQEISKINRKIYKNPFVNCEEETILISQLENQWKQQ